MDATNGADVQRQTSYVNNTSNNSWSYPSAPAWSPDNAKLAFQLDKSSNSAGNTTNICRVPVTADGSGVPVFLTSNGFSYDPAWTIDRTAPTTNITRPALPDYTALKVAPDSAAGTASDLGGSGLSEVTGVLFRSANSAAGTAAGYWLGGTNWTTDSSNPNIWRPRDSGSTLNDWTVALPALPEGAYAFKARVRDGAGNVFTTPYRWFKIDATPPTAAVTTPALPDFKYYKACPTRAEGTASDPNGSGVKEVTGLLYRADNSATGTAAGYWLGGSNWTTDANDPNIWRPRYSGSTFNNWRVTLPDLPDGTYGFRARVKDGAGNIFITPYRWFRIDSIVPTATVTRPAAPDYSTYGSDLTSAAGTASDLGGSGLSEVTGVLFRSANSTTGTAAGYWLGGSNWTTDSSNPNIWRPRDSGSTLNNWTVALPALPNGAYAFKARVKDGAGNIFITSYRWFRIAGSTASSLRLSSAKSSSPPLAMVAASDVDSKVKLLFSSVLDSGTATGAARYSRG
jgi:hypothetical protein